VADDQPVRVDDFKVLEFARLEIVVGHCARVPGEEWQRGSTGKMLSTRQLTLAARLDFNMSFA
jgi:hypothetical protein